MAVVQPSSSKKAVMRVGRELAECYEKGCAMQVEALDVLNNWRLSHSYSFRKNSYNFGTKCKKS
ncbi:hypothetical protein [Photobacterium leiognathi]|uniref:hypothetical protein n=1 Tax=Photobacterium leiognathi TaxID=553611 RepID=UPI002735F943|nr:hypothetical protein [Photobacterium leiognathi]